MYDLTAWVTPNTTDTHTHYSKLKAQWDEKVTVIGRLEQDLSRVQQNFSEQEGRLAEERERALERAR